MKILIVHNHYREPGGEDQAVNTQQQQLEAAGHEVLLYTRFNKQFDYLPMDKKIKFFFSEGLRFPQTYEELKELIQREKPDCAHVHNTFFMMTPSVYEACFELGVPVIQTLHNYRFLCANALFYRRGKICEDCLTKGTHCAVMHRCWRNSYWASYFAVRVIRSMRERGILSRIRLFIAPSEFTRAKFIQAGFPAEKIRVVPHTLGRDPDRPKRWEHYALYAGTLRDYKGIKNLLEIWGGVDNLPLKIIGDGPLRGRIEKFIEDKKLTHVTFLGALGHEQVLEEMKRALLVIAPSRCYETFGVVIMEAYASGVPVIASRIGAFTELVDEGRTGFLFDPYDPKDMLRVIKSARDNSSLLSEMRLAAREKYIRAQNRDPWSGIFHEVCGH